MKAPALTKTQRLFLGCVATSAIGLTLAAPASISVYLIGLFPIVFVSLMCVITRGNNNPIKGAVWLGIPAGILFTFAVITGVIQIKATHSVAQLRDMRRTLLERIEIQIGQPLPSLSPDEETEIARLDESHLRHAQSFGLAVEDAYSEAGTLSILSHNFTKASKLLNISQKSRPLPSTTNNLGVAYYYNGRKDKAAEEFQRAAKEIEQEGSFSSRDAAAVIYANLGVVLRDRGEESLSNGDIQKGISYRDNGELDEALSTFHNSLGKSANQEITLTTKLQIAAVYRIQARYDEALKIANEILDTRQASEHLIASAIKIKGLIADDRNDVTAALEYYSSAAAKFERGGYFRDLAAVFSNMGNVYINDPVHPDPEKALFYQRKAFALDKELGLDIETAIDRANIAFTYYRSNDLTHALEESEAALEVYRREGGHLGAEAAVLDTIGLILQKKHQEDNARSNFELSLQLARRAGDRHGQAEVLRHLSILFANQRKYDSARPLALEAAAIYEQIGDKASAEQTWKMYRSWERLVGGLQKSSS